MIALIASHCGSTSQGGNTTDVIKKNTVGTFLLSTSFSPTIFFVPSVPVWGPVRVSSVHGQFHNFQARDGKKVSQEWEEEVDAERGTN